MQLRHLALACCVATAIDCGSGPAVQPSPVVGDPVVSCPADIAITAHNQQNPTVTFDTPAATGGLPPLTVNCTPESGSQFSSGATSVNCEAADSRQRHGSCTFKVTVTPIPRLVATTFMAFGDSQTEGKPPSLIQTGVEVPDGTTDYTTSYVERLYLKLAGRYQDQTIRLIAQGLGGEETGVAKLRLPDSLARYRPDALLLLDGANDMLNYPNQSGIDSAAEALHKMVTDSRARQVRVFLATIPMTLGTKTTASILAANAKLNERIKAIAAQPGVALVDFASTLPASAIGFDGVHLKPEGYDLMADEWLKAITTAMEVK